MNPTPKPEKIMLKSRKELAKMVAMHRSYIGELEANRNEMIGAYHDLRNKAGAAINVLGVDLAWAEVAIMALQQPTE